MASLKESAILEKAEDLGMDLKLDTSYFYIAKDFLEATTLPPPKPWIEKDHTDPDDGEVYQYYVNEDTAESSWDHPLLGKFKALFEEAKRRRKEDEEADADRNNDSYASDSDRSDFDRNEVNTSDDENYERGNRNSYGREDREGDQQVSLDSRAPMCHASSIHAVKPNCNRCPPQNDDISVQDMDLGEVSLEETVVLSDELMKQTARRAPLGRSMQDAESDDDDDWDNVKGPPRSPPSPDLTMPSDPKRDGGMSPSPESSVKNKNLDSYMTDRGFGRNEVKSSRMLDSRSSSRLDSRGDSRGSTGYDTFTDSVVDERHERRLEMRNSKLRNNSDKSRSSSRGSYDEEERRDSGQQDLRQPSTSYRGGDREFSTLSDKRPLQGIEEERTSAAAAPSMSSPDKYSSLRPEPHGVADMRRKLVDYEKEIEELKDVVEDWRIQKKKSEALGEATSEELSRVRKVLRTVTKERDELSHKAALLDLKLNKKIASGAVDAEGEESPSEKFQRESIEAAAAAKARREVSTGQ